MAGQFNFDEKKTAEENIEAFLLHVESTNKAFGGLLLKNLNKMLPLPDVTKRSTARASFNSEIMKQLDAALAAVRAKKHG
jgi:hypothetical protein